MVSSPPRLLLVDDEAAIVRSLKPSLNAGGFDVVVAGTGEDAIEAIARDGFDVMVLDLGLPDIDGKDVIRKVREHSDVPIIVVSARGLEEEKIKALDSGANDYVAKPAPVGELMARIRAALRARAPKTAAPDALKIGDLSLDFATRRGKVGHRSVRLTQRETDFLKALAAKGGAIASHRELIAAIWGQDAEADAQMVRVLAAQTRHKVEKDPSRPVWIITEPGLGYRLEVEASASADAEA